MIDANEVLKTMCEKYQAAVSANDSIAYGKLFAADAIRIPPGSDLNMAQTRSRRTSKRTMMSRNGVSKLHPLMLYRLTTNGFTELLMAKLQLSPTQMGQ